MTQKEFNNNPKFTVEKGGYYYDCEIHGKVMFGKHRKAEQGCPVCATEKQKEINNATLAKNNIKRFGENYEVSFDDKQIHFKCKIHNTVVSILRKDKKKYKSRKHFCPKCSSYPISIKNTKIKGFYCKKCGEQAEENFYLYSKTLCKKCVRIKNKKYFDENVDKKKYRKKRREYYSKDLIKSRISSAKSRARRYNLDFELTEDIIYDKLVSQNGLCYISKKRLTFTIHDWYCISLDRLNSNLGYTVKNTVLVTRYVNISKNKCSLEEYKHLIREIYHNM